MSEDVQQVSMPDRLNELTWDENSLTQGVQRLAQTLQLLPHPKPVVTLKAILLRLQQIESSDSLESTKAASDFDLLQLPLGFNTDDPALQNAARILRLLLVADLRQLQNEINQLLVATQQQTAQPKTDTSLGQVGR